MDDDDFDEELPDLYDDLDDELDEEDDDEQDDDFGTYQDPDFDPDDDDDDDDEEYEYDYPFLFDPSEVDNLSVAEVENYAQEIDPDGLHEDQEESYEALMARDSQIKTDKASLTKFKLEVKKEMTRIRSLKAQNPEAKQRLPKLKVELKKCPAQLKNKLKKYKIQEAEISSKASKEISKVRVLILKEIAVANAQLAAEVVKDIATKIPPPFNFIVLGVILAIVLIAILILVIAMSFGAASSAPYENVDIPSGQLATAYGIKGDMFYGARYVYYDDEKAIEQLESDYENLVINLITQLNDINGIDATVELTWSGTRPEKITQMIKVVADQTDKSDQQFDNLSQHLEIIDHFGYTASELDNIQIALLDYIKDHIVFIVDTNVFTADFDETYNSIFDQSSNGLDICAPLYFVQDVLFDSETDSLKSMPAKNYIAMIFMPKEDVVIDEISFMLYINEKTNNENAPTNVQVELVKHTQNSETILADDLADSSWWNDDYAEQQTSVATDISLSRFLSVDLSNTKLQEGTSIFSLLQNNGKINKNLLTQLFSIVEQTNETGETYQMISYLPANTSDYLYVRFTSDGEFMFCEYYTEYHKQGE